MRSTVTIDNKRLNELVYETKARSKASAVNEAIREYLRRKKIERIMSMKGKLEFDMDFDEMRHRER
jgi:Arc/MetJ family transcription regulator